MNLKLQGMTNQMKKNNLEIENNHNYIINFRKMISELITYHINDYKVFHK